VELPVGKAAIYRLTGEEGRGPGLENGIVPDTLVHCHHPTYLSTDLKQQLLIYMCRAAHGLLLYHLRTAFYEHCVCTGGGRG
jgi:hypothetical protein